MDGPKVSLARVETPLPQRYMTQLCKHFGHRRPARFTARWARIELASGTCEMEVEPDHLVLRARAPDEAALGELERTVALHLARFAYRDPPAVVWQRAA